MTATCALRIAETFSDRKLSPNSNKTNELKIRCEVNTNEIYENIKKTKIGKLYFVQYL